MSRTHKTDPIRVKAAGHAPRVRAVADHDHRFGECDLPPLDPKTFDHYFATNCAWTWMDEGTNEYCGCAHCTEARERKRERRRDRHQAKASLNRMAKEVRGLPGRLSSSIEGGELTKMGDGPQQDVAPKLENSH